MGPDRDQSYIGQAALDAGRYEPLTLYFSRNDLGDGGVPMGGGRLLRRMLRVNAGGGVCAGLTGLWRLR